jgi:hypothetical protein
VAGDDVVTVVVQLLGHAFDLYGIHVAEHDDTSGAHSSGHRNSHAADTDDGEDFTCCHS